MIITAGLISSWASFNTQLNEITNYYKINSNKCRKQRIDAQESSPHSEGRGHTDSSTTSVSGPDSTPGRRRSAWRPPPGRGGNSCAGNWNSAVRGERHSGNSIAARWCHFFSDRINGWFDTKSDYIAFKNNCLVVSFLQKPKHLWSNVADCM